MAEWDKGVLRVNEGTVLGNPLLEVPEPRLRETGILTVEQLRAFELRLHKYIGSQVADSAKLLTDRLRAADSQSEIRDEALRERTERVAQEAAERGLDLTVRLHAVDQRIGGRITDLTILTTNWHTRQTEHTEQVRVELTRHLESSLTMVLKQLVAESDTRESQYQSLLRNLDRFQQDAYNRTALGRLRRFWAWTVSVARRVRYGR